MPIAKRGNIVRLSASTENAERERERENLKVSKARSLAGRQAEFIAILQNSGQSLNRFAARLRRRFKISDLDDADLYQEICARAWKQFVEERPDDKQPARKWLFAVAHGTAVDLSRRRHRLKRKGDHAGCLQVISGDVATMAAEGLLSGEDNPVERQETREFLLNILGRLPEPLSNVVRLRFLEPTFL